MRRIFNVLVSFLKAAAIRDPCEDLIVGRMVNWGGIIISIEPFDQFSLSDDFFYLVQHGALLDRSFGRFRRNVKNMNINWKIHRKTRYF